MGEGIRIFWGTGSEVPRGGGGCDTAVLDFQGFESRIFIDKLLKFRISPPAGNWKGFNKYPVKSYFFYRFL